MDLRALLPLQPQLPQNRQDSFRTPGPSTADDRATSRHTVSDGVFGPVTVDHPASGTRRPMVSTLINPACPVLSEVAPENRTGRYGVFLWLTEGYEMSTRRRFSGELKAKIALGALRGDRTLQEIASKHPVHPNQVSAWKRQAIAGLGEVFSNGGERRRRDHESEVRELHAKIGELTVERDCLSRGSGR